MSHSQLSDTFLENEEDLFRFLARRLKCVFTARDLTHELFLKVTAQDDTLHIRNNKAYLFRMAANLATDHVRVEQNRADLLAETNDLLWGDVEHRDLERTLIARKELARLEQALANLPPLSRKIFHLNRFDLKPQHEIANELGVSVSTVEADIRKALDRLTAALDRP